MLLFGSVWFFPLITALVAGDIVADEDRNGTLKTILTRSVERQPRVHRQGACRGELCDRGDRRSPASWHWRRRASCPASSRSRACPAPRLSRARPRLVAASLARLPAADMAVASIGLLFSTVFRNSAAAIVGTLMFSLLLQLVAILPGLGGLQPYLLSTQFQAWQGLLRDPGRLGPDSARAWVCALYAVPALVVAWSSSSAATSPASSGPTLGPGESSSHRRLKPTLQPAAP